VEELSYDSTETPKNWASSEISDLTLFDCFCWRLTVKRILFWGLTPLRPLRPSFSGQKNWTAGTNARWTGNGGVLGREVLGTKKCQKWRLAHLIVNFLPERWQRPLLFNWVLMSIWSVGSKGVFPGDEVDV